jgi:cytoplasmic iron level regulating protein YaaA (DUF328/UPF0246 family)
MLILMNTTKTMDLACEVPAGPRTTKPVFSTEAAELTSALKGKRPVELARLMSLSETLADAAKGDLARWGTRGNDARPALLAFTGLVYRYLDAPTLDGDGWARAQDRMRILSGLYGVLRPRDRIEAYRLEMGLKWKPPGFERTGAASLVAYWKEKITARLNKDLKKGEPIVSVAAQEYMKAIDLAALKGPIINPVFKERRHDGSLKTAAVHAKMARGALARYALVKAAETPEDLMGFSELGWEASSAPPESGAWLFTRPVRD